MPLSLALKTCCPAVTGRRCQGEVAKCKHTERGARGQAAGIDQPNRLIGRIDAAGQARADGKGIASAEPERSLGDLGGTCMLGINCPFLL